ncbi:MAG: sulfatase-like hydrolase/transferase [Candidatus Nitrosoglobus sp.]|jgi:arylsulfatase A-like enzyme
MDDVGIDQIKVFGYGGATPPRTPNMDTISKAGARFRNTWSMPECSPSRAEFFERRFLFRTQVLNAILAEDLANSQVSPFEVTTPQILRKQGYESGLFGKFHLSGMENNPYGNQVVTALGWDYFAGYLPAPRFPSIPPPTGSPSRTLKGWGLTPAASSPTSAMIRRTVWIRAPVMSTGAVPALRLIGDRISQLPAGLA